MKAANFSVVSEAKKAANGQLTYYKKMMEAKTAQAPSKESVLTKVTATQTKKK